MPVKSKQKRPIGLIILLIVAVVLFGVALGLLIWVYIVRNSLGTRLQTLNTASACTASVTGTAPTGVTIVPTPATAKSVDVSWTAVSGATGYYVTVQKVDSATIVTQSAGASATKVTVAVATSGDKYIAMVQALSGGCNDGTTATTPTTYSTLTGTYQEVIIPKLSDMGVSAASATST